MSPNTRPQRIASIVALCLLVFTTAAQVHAFSGGITTQNFGGSGCNSCHFGGTAPTVSFTGPSSVAPDSTNEYTLEVFETATQHFAGLNVSGGAGVLMTGGGHAGNTQILVGTGGRNEVTHTSAKAASGGVVTFSFLWTAPSAFSSVSLKAWGNAVNGNSSTAGDMASTMTLVVSNVNGGSTPSPTQTPVATPTPTLDDPLRPIRLGRYKISLQTVATGLTAPVWATDAPGVDPKFLFVVDQAGILWRVDVTNGDKSVYLDLSSRLIPLGVFGAGTYDERGFLGVAFDPNYATNGLLYTYTSEPATPNPDFSTMPPGNPPDHQSVLVEWHAPNPTDPGAIVDTGSARVLLRFDKPQFNHNGGGLSFGPDGMLYVSIGDGGGADDEDGQPFIGGPVVGHGPNGNGQNLGSVLGKILRIDPHGNTAANGQYGVPADNPFFNMPGVVGEIWAYGFRNPFRFSFDANTGALYVGDVGQNDIEEVDVVTRGGNYGWRHKEGRFFFVPNGTGAGFVSRHDPGVPPGLLDPVGEYDHDDGLAVIGGFVYRGTAIPKLVGRYVTGDFARTFTNDGRLFYLLRREIVRPGRRLRRTKVAEFRLVGQATYGMSLLGLGQDAAGEIYALGNTTAAPFGTTGVVQRIIPAP